MNRNRHRRLRSFFCYTSLLCDLLSNGNRVCLCFGALHAQHKPNLSIRLSSGVDDEPLGSWIATFTTLNEHKSREYNWRNRIWNVDPAPPVASASRHTSCHTCDPPRTRVCAAIHFSVPLCIFCVVIEMLRHRETCSQDIQHNLTSALPLPFCRHHPYREAHATYRYLSITIIIIIIIQSRTNSVDIAMAVYTYNAFSAACMCNARAYTTATPTIHNTTSLTHALWCCSFHMLAQSAGFAFIPRKQRYKKECERPLRFSL